jgi:hypothetical protein
MSSESGNLIIAAVNQISSSNSSAILVFAWLPIRIHMLQESPVSKIPFYGRKIKSFHILGKDYFGTANAKRDQTISSEALNDTICVLFEDGTLELVDLDFGHSKRVEIEPVKSVELTKNGTLCALTASNKLVEIDIQASSINQSTCRVRKNARGINAIKRCTFQHSMPSLKQDLTEELVISLLSAFEKFVPESDVSESLNSKLQVMTSNSPLSKPAMDALQGTCAWTLDHSFDIKKLAHIWSLICAEPFVRNQASGVNSTSTLPTSPMFNSRSHVSTSQQAQL